MAFLLNIGFALSLLVLTSSALDCIPRNFGNEGTVCVCNSTYCDSSEPLPDLNFDGYAVYTSSLSGLRYILSTDSFENDTQEEGVQFTLNEDDTYQRVEGFGGAFTDTTGINIVSLSEAAQDLLMEAYFSKAGNAYTLGRIPIAGTDFSLRPYTYADSGVDPTLSNFNLTEDDYLYKIPIIKRAMNLSGNTLRFLAAAWTAPPWMKTNNDYIGRGFLKEEYYSTWSDYHLRFLERYAEEGIEIWALSTGNEPLNGDIPFFFFNCMGWSPQSQKKWVTENIGPALQQSAYNKTILMAYDDQRIEMPLWLNNLFSDGEAQKYFSAIGVHWYWDKVSPVNNLDKVHEAYPEMILLATEASVTRKQGEDIVVFGSWERGERYAESIIDDMNHWAQSWVDWNLAVNASGGPSWASNECDGAVVVNSTADEFYKQPMFYAIGHFSKFVQPGSVRVQLEGGNDNVKGVAFRTPEGLIATVILNKEDSDILINLESKTGTAAISAPAKSISTILHQAQSPTAR